MKRLILDTKIMVVCQSACGSAGITANVISLGEVADFGKINCQPKNKYDAKRKRE